MSKLKKIDQISEESYPEFPTINGGYVEDSVDKYIKETFESIKQVIAYQHHCVDVAEGLEEAYDAAASENESLKAEWAEEIAESNRLLDSAGEEIENLKKELADTQAALVAVEAQAIAEPVVVEEVHEEVIEEVIEEPVALEETITESLQSPSPVVVGEVREEPAAVLPGVSEGAQSAALLLQHAQEVADSHISEAKIEAAGIIEHAKGEAERLTEGNAHLRETLHATLTNLTDFHKNELEKLANDSILADVQPDSEEG